jgi:intracellular septation protein A
MAKNNFRKNILPIFIIILFFIFTFIANLYKAKWRGEEVWTKSNVISFVLIFIVCLIASAIYYYFKDIRKK